MIEMAEKKLNRREEYEKQGKGRLDVPLPRHLGKRLRFYAVRSNKTIAQVVAELVAKLPKGENEG